MSSKTTCQHLVAPNGAATGTAPAAAGALEVSSGRESITLKATAAQNLEQGYGVTTCDPANEITATSLVADIETYLSSYVMFADPCYVLPIALWLAATHKWQSFDAFPYLVVTSSTKRSGKTRLMELLSFIAANARAVAHISPAAMFHTIHTEKPTLFVDEAESFSSANSEFRPLLNTGYRRGQKVLRQNGGGTVEYDTYCPKAFALIGDVYDTLRDRSIVIVMKRGTPKQRFIFVNAQQDGNALRERLSEIAQLKAAEIYEAAVSFEGLPFLTDRDEEIWTPLFIICKVLCPDRIHELTRAAADIATAKTADPRKFTELAGQEKEAEEQEYAQRLLLDVLTVMGNRKHLSTAELIPALRAIPTSPWRKFRGTGLKDGIDGAMDIAALLKRFGVKSKTIRIAPKNQKNSTVKGFKRDTLLRAAEPAGLLGRNPITLPMPAMLPSTDSGRDEAAAPDEAASDDIVKSNHLESGNPARHRNSNGSKLLVGKKYTVRPVPREGFGVYEVGGSPHPVDTFVIADDAWQAIFNVAEDI